MPLHIIRNNIVNMECDAIVNTTNPYPQIGSGTDSAVYAAAGEKRLLAARKKIGEIAPGLAAVTSGYALKARYIIHTVGPVWEGGGNGEELILRSCYRTSLRIAEAKRCKSVAFPLISTGSYGYPKEAALKTAVEEIRSYLEHSNMTVYLVVFGKEAYELSGKYSDAVEAFIDEHYVNAQLVKEYSGLVTGNLRGTERRRWDNLQASRKADSQKRDDLQAYGTAERRRRHDLQADGAENGRREEKLQTDQVSRPGWESAQPDRAADSGSKDNLQAYRTEESGQGDNLWADDIAESEFLEDQLTEMADIDKESAWEPESSHSDMSEYMGVPQSAAPGFGMPQPGVPKSAAPGFGMPQPDVPKSAEPEFDMFQASMPKSAAPRPAPLESAAKSSPRFSFRPAASVLKKKKKLEEAAPAHKKKKKLEDSDIVLAETFSETLLRLIDEKEMTDVEVYKRANIDRKLFSKIRSRRDYQPGKKTALALAVALRLDLDQTKDLLSRAGYAISPSSKFDLIVEFFIVNEVYDIDTINIALFDHQEQTLG